MQQIVQASKKAKYQMKKNYGMKRILLVVVALLFVVLVAFAAGKPYWVTRSVLELTANEIVVQKGKEKWGIPCDVNRRLPAILK
jgi:hypothetical protein